MKHLSTRMTNIHHVVLAEAVLNERIVLVNILDTVMI